MGINFAQGWVVHFDENDWYTLMRIYNSFKIDIYYQIEAVNGGTKAIIEYKDKKTNLCSSFNYKLQFYEDIYSLVDSISLTGDTITFKPKKSFTADIHNERYKTPITFKLTDFEKFNCH